MASPEVKTRVAAPQPGPLLTVFIPTCNGAGHLAETIRSILSQDGVAFELAVSDDRSDDSTLALVRREAGDRARIEVNSERLGLAGNWNRCAALARTPLVCIFHQDDVMQPGHLSAHAASFAADDSIGLTASASVVIDERGRPVPPDVVEQGGLGPIDRMFEPGQMALSMAAGNPLRCSAVTLRVAALNEADGFDPRLRYVVDWDCWLRISRTWQVAWLARPTVQVRWHPASETHRFKTGLADLDETTRMLKTLFELDLKDRSNTASLRRAANDRLSRAFLNRAHDALRAGLPELAREALSKGVRLSPGLIKAIVADPRLCVQMAALAAAPDLAARLFANQNR
jgi:glycosyltransferase involved in cell wall biosynthesis